MNSAYFARGCETKQLEAVAEDVLQSRSGGQAAAMVVDVLRDGRGGVNPAGYTASSARRAAEGSAADCLTIGQRPTTPPEIR